MTHRQKRNAVWTSYENGVMSHQNDGERNEESESDGDAYHQCRLQESDASCRRLLQEDDARQA